MKTIKIGSVSIPLDLYTISGSAILGIKGAGKTYTAKGIAEQLLEHNIPIVAFDAIGVWRYLKAAGPNGKGFKVVVAGGEEPDLPLTPESAPEIVRAAIRENIPLVIDLYDRNLSKADWRRIVQACFRVLLYENKGLRHIFLEEAPEYVPQKVMDGVTYAEVEKLVRMGGNASLGITLISQRAQEVNKAVLDLCENVILMRQRGAHAIDNLAKWTEKLSPSISKQIATDMPTMKAGEAWIFTSEDDEPVRTRSALLKSYHPDRRKPNDRKDTVVPTDTSDFVSRLGNLLTNLKVEAEANDPKALRKRIADLEEQLANNVGGLALAELETARQEGYGRGYRDSENKQRGLTQHKYRALHLKLRNELDQAFDELQKRGESTIEVNGQPMTAAEIDRIPIAFENNWQPLVERMPPRKVERSTPIDRQRIVDEDAGGSIPKGEQAILQACIQHPKGLRRDQLNVLAGYKKSSRDAYIARLTGKGYLEIASDGRVAATTAGRKAMPNVRPLPTGRALREHWLQRLPEGERVILAELIDKYPEPASRSGLDKLGYKKSSRDAYIARLSARGLVKTPNAGKVAASDDLF